VGLQREDSYATASVAQSHSFQDAILPIAEVIIEHLNNKVIDFYAEGFTIAIADEQPTKEDEEANRANTLYQMGKLITRNEGRQMVGLPPLAGEDKFADGSAEGQGAEDASNPVDQADKKDTGEEEVEGEEKEGDKTAEQNGKNEQNGKKNEQNGKKPPLKKKQVAASQRVTIQASVKMEPIQLSLF
jgi:hypothetical protein